MKKSFAITVVVLLSSAMFLVGVCVAGGPVTKTTTGKWSGIDYIVGQEYCPDDYVLAINTGKGNMTLTGESQWFALGCLHPINGDGTGTGVITAADGDQIYVEFTSQLEYPYPGTFTEWETIIGGTGKFEDATGTSTTEGTYNLVGDPIKINVWSATNVADITF
jgi:hypothetical protein